MEFGKFAKTQRKNTGNLVCSRCKFPDSKSKRYFEICCENLQFFFKLDKSAKSQFFSWTGKRQGKDREFENAI